MSRLSLYHGSVFVRGPKQWLYKQASRIARNEIQALAMMKRDLLFALIVGSLFLVAKVSNKQNANRNAHHLCRPKIV